MAKFTFHVVALPHTQTSKKHNGCAFTIKVYNFCKMMHERGHVVFHYGTEGSDCPCTEHVQTLSLAEQQGFFPGKDWRKDLADSVWDTSKRHWAVANDRAAVEILRRSSRGDFVCLIAGVCQQPVASKVEPEGLMAVEYGIGYNGPFAKYRVFESYAHMHRLYGTSSHDPDGNYFDAVIPNYYDPADFPFCPHKEDYFLFMGRLVIRKGVGIAVEAARAAGARLLLCGQGVKEVKGNAIVTGDLTYSGDHLEFVGFADVKRRAELMGRARGVFVPTAYIEPFGGVNVEAQLCGTPVLTSDWGAFTETVLHGVTGYRCRTLEQFVWAARNVHRLDPQVIRERALALYSLERVAGMYEEYFGMLQTLWGDGWYARKERTQLDWLTDPFIARRAA
jgi:glycosyltransferase involved in cell wall biosynthesis